MIPFQPDLPKYECRPNIPHILQERGHRMRPTQTTQKFNQEGSMNTRAFPTTPPKMPKLQSEGTIEKQVSRVLISSPTQNTNRRALKSLLLNIILSQTPIPS